MSSFAPIALFVYNRPHHTQRTIDCLRQNTLAKDSNLYIFSDGLKTAKDVEKVKEVRSIIRQVTDFRHIEIIEQEKNKGLANSIIDGVASLIDTYGKVIVMEDDLESSPYLLQYFNDALNFYQDKEQVMHISAYTYPINSEGLSETFLFRVPSSWGWATWKRAWQYFEPNMEKLYFQFDKEKIYDFSVNQSENFWKQVKECRQGKIDSWAIRWYASIFLQGGLSLYPSLSMVNNIGNDASGTHSDDGNDMYKTAINDYPITYFSDEIKEDKNALQAVIHFYQTRKGPYIKRLVRFIQTKYKRLFK